MSQRPNPNQYFDVASPGGGQGSANVQNGNSFSRVFEMMNRLETIEAYVGPLLEAWSAVLIEDNRRGVMMGIDGDGVPLKPTKYRHSITQTSAGGAGDKFFDTSGQAFDFNPVTAGSSSFFGATRANLSGTADTGPMSGFKPGPSHNLTTKEYKALTGPPLAPRGPASRVISNYVVEVMAGTNMVGVEGGWNDIVSRRGTPFLSFHFNGATFSRAFFATSIGGENHHLPRRNLVGLRQWGKTQARKELNAWVTQLMTVTQVDYFTRSAKHNPKYVRLKTK